jgi:hypothetical protein
MINKRHKFWLCLAAILHASTSSLSRISVAIETDNLRQLSTSATHTFTVFVIYVLALTMLLVLAFSYSNYNHQSSRPSRFEVEATFLSITISLIVFLCSVMAWFPPGRLGPATWPMDMLHVSNLLSAIAWLCAYLGFLFRRTDQPLPSTFLFVFRSLLCVTTIVLVWYRASIQV